MLAKKPITAKTGDFLDVFTAAEYLSTINPPGFSMEGEEIRHNVLVSATPPYHHPMHAQLLVCGRVASTQCPRLGSGHARICFATALPNISSHTAAYYDSNGRLARALVQTGIRKKRKFCAI